MMSTDVYGRASAGNNRAVHVLRSDEDSHYRSMCGVRIPKKPQSTQGWLPKCQRCF